jgi:hypothetical protein
VKSIPPAITVRVRWSFTSRLACMSCIFPDAALKMADSSLTLRFYFRSIRFRSVIVLKVTGSILGPETWNSDWNYLWFSPVPTLIWTTTSSFTIHQ